MAGSGKSGRPSNETRLAALREKRPLERGDAVWWVRVVRQADEPGGIRSQCELYERCWRIETQSPDLQQKGKKRPRFAWVEKSNRRKKISRRENNRESLSVEELAIFAIALGLPRDFFARDFPDLDALAEAYDQAMAGEAAASDGADWRVVDASKLGFHHIHRDEPLPESRRALCRDLTERLTAPAPRSSLTVLNGRTGVGKSFIISYWFQHHGREHFGESAIRVDCRDVAPPNLAPHIRRRRDTGLGGRGPALIVLDQIVNQEALHGEQPALSDPLYLSELIEAIAALESEFDDLRVVLCVENNDAPLDEREIFDLAPKLDLAVVRVEPLSLKEGAAFLEDLSPDCLGEEDREAVSRCLHGLPDALSCAARVLKRMRRQERETYIEQLAGHGPSPLGPSPARESAQLRSMVLQWVGRVAPKPTADGGSEKQDGTHTHALLRLLALMPGATPVDLLEEIIESGYIKRVDLDGVHHLQRGALPYVSTHDGKVELHAILRDHLRGELDEMARTGRFDGTTSREELDWIHWYAARHHWRVMKGEQEFDADMIADIDAFVYHMTERIKLIPRKGRGSHLRNRKNYDPAVRPEKIDEFERDRRINEPSSLGHIQMWAFAMHRGVGRFLLDSRRSATRVHGEYRQKAQILWRLLDVAESEGIKPPAEELVRYHQETALCWLQAGRLQLAGRHLDIARGIARARADAADALALPADPEDKSGRQIWSALCELSCLDAELKLRGQVMCDKARDALVDVIDDAEAHLEGRIEQARRGSDGADAQRWGSPVDRAAMKAVHRVAEIDLKKGDLEAALTRFAKVDEIRRTVRGERLGGAAARRYVVALARSGPGDPSDIEAAEELVESNMRVLKDFQSAPARGRRNVSVEIVPFLTLRAALARIAGDAERARRRLAEARDHDYVRARRVSFVALTELALEEARQAIAFGEPDESLATRLGRLADKMKHAQHMQHNVDARLLGAELLSGEARRAELVELLRLIRSTQYHLRRADIDVLFGGGSAVKSLGL